MSGEIQGWTSKENILEAINSASEHDEKIKIAKENNVPVIFKKCMYMFAEPVGSIHKFHRYCVKAFGAYPKVQKTI